MGNLAVLLNNATMDITDPKSKRISTASLTTKARVAWLHSHFLLWSGGTKFVYEVAKRLSKEFPVDIYVERCSPELAEMFEAAGLVVREINSRSSTSAAYWLLFPFYFFRDVRKIKKIRTEYPLMICSIFPMNHAAGKAGVKYLSYVLEPYAFFHDREMIAGYPLWKRLALHLLSALYRSWDVRGVRNAEEVMTINSGTAECVKRLYGRDPSLSLLGVDAGLFSPKQGLPLYEKIRSRYAGRKLIIHSTDFTPLKRTWDAVKIVEKIRKEMPEVKLLITQSHAYPEESARLSKYLRDSFLEDHVEITGFIPHEELPFYYSAADIALYTGIGSGAGAASLFVLECMACGTPAVRTDLAKDEVEHNVNGFLYRAGDEGSPENYVLTLLRDEKLRGQFSEKARRKVLDLYNWDTVAQRFLTILKKMADNAPLRGHHG